MNAVNERIGRSFWPGDISWSLTAVIFLVIVETKLETVVTPTHEVSLTASMSVMLTSVCRSVTVSLSLTTRLLWSTAPPTTVIPPGTSLTWPRGFSNQNRYRMTRLSPDGGSSLLDKSWASTFRQVLSKRNTTTDLGTILALTSENLHRGPVIQMANRFLGLWSTVGLNIDDGRRDHGMENPWFESLSRGTTWEDMIDWFYFYSLSFFPWTLPW